MGAKAREIDGCKLWYLRSNWVRNGVGILADEVLVNLVVEVRCKIDRIMAIKVVMGSKILNLVSVYAPQISLVEDIKKQFREDLDQLI